MILSRISTGRSPMIVGIPSNVVLSGDDICRLMRRNNVTIRGLKQRTQITMKCIREIRESGLTDRETARDWIQAITGNDPGSNWTV